MKLCEIHLEGMLPAPLRYDPTSIAMARALRACAQTLAAESENALILPRVYQLDAALLDELAWSLCVFWYDSTATTEAKREIIAESDKVHMRMGTPYATEQVTTAYFGASTVEEWFQYDRTKPYHFRVKTPNLQAIIEKRKDFYRTVHQTKNVRSVFEGIFLDARPAPTEAFAGMTMRCVRMIRVEVSGLGK